MTRAPSVSPPLHRCCRLVMALSAAVLLSACSILPSQTPMDTYVLPAPVTQKTPASAGANTGLALRMTRPLVDGAIAGRRIVVMPQAGRISVYQDAQRDYIRYIQKAIHTDLKGLRVALDCANGSASATAKNRQVVLKVCHLKAFS